jgi:hypothetical protein
VFGPLVEHGISMEEARRMTLHDVAMLHRYWKRNPPLRVLVACVAKALGVTFPDPDKPVEKPSYFTADEMKALLRVTGGRIEGMGPFHG